jgi:cell wall assembly regulator SMI1
MAGTWDRFERMLDERFPAARVGRLNGPATARQIAEVERAMGVALPDDLRAAYLRHDGVDCSDRWNQAPGDVPRLILPFYEWVTLEQMLSLWELERDLEIPERESGLTFVPLGSVDRIQRGMFDARWIPVGDARADTTVFVDLHPGPAGIRGQLIKRSLSGRETKYIAASFTAYVDRLLAAIESGRIVIGDDERWHDASTGMPALSVP